MNPGTYSPIPPSVGRLFRRKYSGIRIYFPSPKLTVKGNADVGILESHLLSKANRSPPHLPLLPIYHTTLILFLRTLFILFPFPNVPFNSMSTYLFLKASFDHNSNEIVCINSSDPLYLYMINCFRYNINNFISLHFVCCNFVFPDLSLSPSKKLRSKNLYT